jgi:hypothetical protein
MHINFGRYLNKFNHKLGNIFFKNDNLFTYNLYNHYSDRKKKYRLNNNDSIKEFHYNGFANLESIPIKEIENLYSEIIKQNPKDEGDHRFDYNIDDNIKKIIRNIVQKYLVNLLDDLKKYYNSNLYFTDFNLRRTYGFSKKDQNQKEFFAENWHCDVYINNFLKIFINISDIKKENGPTNILSKSQTKNFMNKSNYNNRNKYNEESYNEKEIYLNIGKKGKVLICNTTQCLHRAGIPFENHSRDLLIISLVAIPKMYEDSMHFVNQQQSIVWNNDRKKLGAITKKYSKPVGIINLIKNFTNC